MTLRLNNWIWSNNIRYKFGRPKPIEPPKLPEPVATPQTLTVEAQKVGQAERRRLRGQKGRASTIFAGRRALEPATVQQRALKTTLG